MHRLGLKLFRRHQLGDVPHFHLVILRRDTVGHHRQTKRTGDGDGFGVGVEGFGYSAGADAFFGGVVEPHAAAASSAAGGLATGAGHLVYFWQQRAGGFGDAIDAGEVAGVVVGYTFVHHGGGF